MARVDQRKDTELREMKITCNYTKYAEGSCLFEMGDTKVVCTASLEDKIPPFLKDTGSGWITAEYGMHPRSTHIRSPREASRGKIGGRTHEIRRLIGRSLRAVTDLSTLGERTIWIDCDVLQADGGTRCASISGGFIALVEALKKMRKEGQIKTFPIKDFVGAISVGILRGKPILDLTYKEDSQADVDMNVVMTSADKFIEVQGTAERDPFTKAQMDNLLSLAKKGIFQLIETQRKIVGDII